MDKFEVTLKLIVNLDQFMAYTASNKWLMHDPTMHNHPLLINLIVSHIEMYQDAQQTISSFLKLEAIGEKFPFTDCKLAQKEDNRVTK